jgi:hypothetical protein
MENSKLKNLVVSIVKEVLQEQAGKKVNVLQTVQDLYKPFNWRSVTENSVMARTGNVFAPYVRVGYDHETKDWTVALLPQDRRTKSVLASTSGKNLKMTFDKAHRMLDIKNGLYRRM